MKAIKYFYGRLNIIELQLFDQIEVEFDVMKLKGE